jgi:hypothetical protein
MRTKLILTTAALGVAGSLGASAQVYSVNAVGYINITIPAKNYVLAANQLNTGGNKISEVIPTVPDGTLVFKYLPGAGFAANGFDFGAWTVPDQVVAPGEGFFFQNNGTTPLTITLVGEVPQGALSTALVAGLNLVASKVPQAGKLATDLGYTPADGDIVYQWDTAAQTYKQPNAFDFGAWTGGEPNLAVGEGFFLQRGAAGTWARTFSVN